VFDEEIADGRVRHFGRVLRGDDDVFHLHRLVVLVADGDLGFRVGAQPGDDAGLADLGQLAAEAVCKHDGRGHHLGRLVAGVAKHEALVAGPLLGGVFTLGGALVDALRDVGRLTREVVVDENLVGVKDVVGIDVADVADRVAHDLLVVDLGLGGDLAGENDHVGFHHGLASDTTVGILREAGIKHAVGNQVGNFVRMAFANGLGGENKGFGHK